MIVDQQTINREKRVLALYQAANTTARASPIHILDPVCRCVFLLKETVSPPPQQVTGGVGDSLFRIVDTHRHPPPVLSLSIGFFSFFFFTISIFSKNLVCI